MSYNQRITFDNGTGTWNQSGFDKLQGILAEHSDKWVPAAIVTGFGAGIAYLLYKRQPRTDTHHQRNTLKSIAKQTDDESALSLVQRLPPEIRTEIWKKLPTTDHLSLRLTARFTKYDIDTFVGVSGRITTQDPVKYEFYQSVALHSCHITDLEEPINGDFLLNPNVLERLEIRDHTPIPLDNIRAILAVSINLRSLKLRVTTSSSGEDLSKIVLQHLPAMKSLSFLQIKTIHRYSPEMKRFTTSSPRSGQVSPWPRRLKTVILEMSDLPSEQLTRWKSVLDGQMSLETIVSSIGNVFWRFYEPVLRNNAVSLKKISLDGLRSWDLERQAIDPFDWTVFGDCVQLESIDLACTRGGQHDTMESVNFDAVPCAFITEFFVSRIIMPPEAVERVYTGMTSLQRGALDQIGNQGIDRANEMAWLLQQNEFGEQDRWWRDDRLWDILANAVFGLTMVAFLSVVLRRRTGGDFPIFGTNEQRNYNESSGEEQDKKIF